jgi:hypothetical protein
VDPRPGQGYPRLQEDPIKNGDVAFPVTLKIDLPDRDLDRLSTGLRLFFIVPIAIVLGLLSGATWS